MLARPNPLAYAIVVLLSSVLLAMPATGDDGDEKASPNQGDKKNEDFKEDKDGRFIHVFESANRTISVEINFGDKIPVPQLPPFDQQRQPQLVILPNGDTLIVYIGHSSTLNISAMLVARIKRGEKTIAGSNGVASATNSFVIVNPSGAADSGTTVYDVAQVNPVGASFGEIFLTRSFDGGATFPPTGARVLSNVAVNSSPHLGVGPASRAFVSWWDMTTTPGDLVVATSSDRFDTFVKHKVATSPSHPRFPFQRNPICSLGGDELLVTRSHCVAGRCQITMWRSTDLGANWENLGPIAPAPFDQHFPSMFCGPAGIDVLYLQDAGVGPLNNVWLTRSTDLHAWGWTPPVRVNRQALDLKAVNNASTAEYPAGAAPNPLALFDSTPAALPVTAAQVIGPVPGTQVFTLWTALTALSHPDIFIAGTPSGNPVVGSVLPGSRSVQVGATATAFVTIINTGSTTATGVGISLLTAVPATFTYQITNALNVPVGTPNTPVDIPAGQAQTFVIAITPTAPFPPADVLLKFTGGNTVNQQTVIGLNTLLATASATAVPDIIALVATPNGNGILDLAGPTGAGAFAVATTNIGASDLITVSAAPAGVSLPVTVTVCQTNSQTGQCLATPAPSVQTQIAPGATPTFAFFVVGSGIVPFDPANNRLNVTFIDGGGVIRGSTNLALRTL